MEENIKEKSIKLAIEAMRPLPVNSFAGYCSVGDDRSPEEKHKDDMRYCKEFNELQSEMLIGLANKIKDFLSSSKQMETGQKQMPPLGVMPKNIYYKNVHRARFHELCGAVSRYYNAGFPIKLEWIEEYNELLGKI